MDNMALILVHGAAGRVPATKWLDQINAGMREVGGPSIEDHDTVACAEYELELRNPAAMTLPRVRGCADLLGAETQYATQQAELAEAVRPFQSPSRWQTTALAELSWAKPLGFRQARTRLPLLRHYHGDALARQAAQAAVLDTLARYRRSVVIAHSLGTVVVADVLRRLPVGLTIELLVTLGSPLSTVEIGGGQHELRSEFPYDRVWRWLNIYNSQDPVCGFAGLWPGGFPTVDLHADLGSMTHKLEHYLRSPALAAAMKTVMFVHDASSPPNGPVQRRIDEHWWPLLLQTSFAAKVAVKLPSKQRDLRSRLEEGLRVAAQEILSAAHAQHALHPTDPRAKPSALPSQRELLGDGWRIVKDCMDDAELLPAVVAMLVQPILPPLDIDNDDEQLRNHALVWLLNRVRRSGSDISDHEYVAHARDAITWAKEALGTGVRWEYVAIGVGLAVLAGTGIGLAAVVPASLGGAAAVTSTLAAFGPGGMVGGIATLATLTGTGAAATSLGTVELLTPAQRMAAKSANTLSASTHALLALPIAELKGALVGGMAVTRASSKMGLTVDSTFYATVGLAHDALTARLLLLSRLSPGSRMHKACEARLKLLSKALKAMRQEMQSYAPPIAPLLALPKAEKQPEPAR